MKRPNPSDTRLGSLYEEEVGVVGETEVGDAIGGRLGELPPAGGGRKGGSGHNGQDRMREIAIRWEKQMERSAVGERAKDSKPWAACLISILDVGVGAFGEEPN
ncbi:hypothetical protein BHM03_00051633 [Ensete ventricosum]|nr:hypothetical protein BHM03_00051633 [Ensete ventricosum]